MANADCIPFLKLRYPYVTGTSVLGVTYKDGVMLACDTLGAYGSTKRYKSFERLNKVNDSCVIAAGGELSDFQHIVKMLGELADEDFCLDDGHQLKPGEVFAYLTRVMYDRRNKFDPLWNSVVVAGYHGGTPFLGTVGMIGTNYKDETIATGFGNHLARPLMRERHRPDMDESEALQLLHDCLRVCYYRDKVSINKFQVSKVTKDGVEISEPFSLETKWDYKLFVNPTANAVGAW
jgi:20S proteasome subunit beta 7